MFAWLLLWLELTYKGASWGQCRLQCLHRYRLVRPLHLEPISSVDEEAGVYKHDATGMLCCWWLKQQSKCEWVHNAAVYMHRQFAVAMAEEHCVLKAAV